MKFEKKSPRQLDLESKQIMLDNQIYALLRTLPDDSVDALKAALDADYGCESFRSVSAHEQRRFRGLAEAVARTEKALVAISKPRF